MPATFAGASTTNLSTYAANPPGAQTPAASPLSGIGDRPTFQGSGNYSRSLDQSDGDAIANLTGAVTGRGLYQDITAFIGVMSPPALLRAVRDAINFMLLNAPAT